MICLFWIFAILYLDVWCIYCKNKVIPELDLTLCCFCCWLGWKNKTGKRGNRVTVRCQDCDIAFGLFLDSVAKSPIRICADLTG